MKLPGRVEGKCELIKLYSAHTAITISSSTTAAPTISTAVARPNGDKPETTTPSTFALYVKILLSSTIL